MFVVGVVDPCKPKLLLGVSFGVFFVVLVLMFFNERIRKGCKGMKQRFV